LGGGRGRLISVEDKARAIALIQEACDAGARIKPACEIVEIAIRTLQRWKKGCSLNDKRCGPNTEPKNKFTQAEREHLLKVVNSEAYRNQAPGQIVPALADKGEYIGSESTIYRILRAEKLLTHRSAARPNRHQKPAELSATKPNVLWSWDITYLLSSIRGQYFYLYLFLDIFSRKIVGHEVYAEQSAEQAAEVVSKAYSAEGVRSGEVTVHADNGGPMKGSMMLAKLELLGVAASFSRPSVSNDNPFSEALFRTLKYRPEYPSKPFENIEDARTWVSGFVNWYNTIHQHSGISFVTPAARHKGEDKQILENRKAVYALAKGKNPNRWSGQTRKWAFLEKVYLNAKHSKDIAKAA
jgi:putative transposase